MSATTARFLAMLAALQSRPEWTGPQLAAHLGVTVRTVRRDIERARELGYPIDSHAGTDGGYRLGVGGAAVPPLMLEADEAFALAAWVRAADSSQAIGLDEPTGLGETARRALGKLEQMLPAPVRRQIDLSTAVIPVQAPIDDLDSAIVRTLVAACRDHEVVAVTYRDRHDRLTERRLHPYRVVNLGRRWYLVARDAQKPGWRTWRIDRVQRAAATGHRFELVDPPDAVALVQRSVSTAPYRHHARVRLEAPVEQVQRLVPPSVGVLEAIDEGSTLLTTGSDHLDAIAWHIGLLGVPFRVVEPDELRARMVDIAERLRAGAGDDGRTAFPP
ncbi:MAG: helix-turn-helix transcriptional regulator [Ilumatobacteraceae bacterium]